MIEHLQEYLGLYMFGGLIIMLFTGLPVMMVIGGVTIWFAVFGILLDVVSTADFFLFVDRMWQSNAQSQILVAIPCFIFMGIMLEQSGIASGLLRIMHRAFRRVPGGLALSVTALGTILAATTGIIGASVVMITLMALPTMLNNSYSQALSCGTIAASSTLGILIPPSIMLVIMADLLSVSVGNLFLGAVVPGLLLSALYFVYILGHAIFRPQDAPKLPEEDGDDAESIASLLLKGVVPPVALIILVLGSIFGGWATPTEAAGIGAVGATALACIYKCCTFEILGKVCKNTALTTAMIFAIMIAASSFSYLFRALYGEELILDFIYWLQLDGWGLLLILMLAIFILGFFLDWIEITLIILPVFTPILAAFGPDFAMHLGVEGLPDDQATQALIYWFAILVAINLQASFLTPPFGFALFFLKGAAPPNIKMKAIYRGIIPFVGLQLFGLACVVLWPELTLWLPAQLLE